MEHRLPSFATGKKFKLPEINSERKNELIADLAPEKYHAITEAVSSSGIRKILRSPKHFLAWLSGMEDEEDKEHFRFGRIAHLCILEPWKFMQFYKMMPEFGDMRSSKNREARDEWKKEQPSDAVILNESDYNVLHGMIESIREHPIAKGLLENGQAEMSGFYTDPETGILCRVRPDFLSRDKNGNLVLIDFKTSRDTRTGIFSDSAYRYGYDTQLAFYADCISGIMKEQIHSCVLIAVEKNVPYDTCVYVCSDEMITKGREKYRHALTILKQCLVSGEWPGTQKYAQELELPNRSNFDLLPEFNFGGRENG